MGTADEGWLPLLPNSSGRVAISSPVQNRGQRSRRRVDTSAIRRGGEGTFVGEFPPVAAFPVQPENHLGSGGLASSRGFSNAASSMGSSRGFFSRTVAAARRGADIAGCPSGGMRFFGNPTIEEPLVASLEAPLAPVKSEVDDESKGSNARESPQGRGRPAPLETLSPSDLLGDSPESQDSPASPVSAKDKSVSFEERLKRKAGCPLHTLHLGDLRRSKTLRSEMQTMKLHDYFDIRGTPRFRRLGLSFAAKQNAEVKDSFGSSVKAEDDDDGNRRNFSAKSYFCATQAILKDIHYGESMKLQTLKSVEEMERFRAEDVQLRQLEMLFLEVPDFEHYMPTDIDYSELIPPAIDKDAEIKERRSSERATSHLADMRWVEGRRMGWMLTREEALLLTDFIALWTRASRTTNCPFGMDRPTFCRMILDLDLVDQEKVPYYWAISLFDSVAQSVRCCPADATWSNTAPSAFVVNRWALLSIFDTLLRQHFDESSKSRFFDTLKEVAATALPAHLRSSVQELVKKSEKRPTSKSSSTRDRSKTASRESNRSQPAEGRKVKASQFQSEPPVGSRFKSRVQAASVHFKMLTNVMVGLNKAGDLEIDDDGTKNIHNLVKAEEEEKAEKRDPEQADHNTVPAWLKPPELPAPNLDTTCERLARDRLVTGMLVEPEVLHLVAQYHKPFAEMHRIYADSKGHMSFHELLQFCHDFRLTPQLVSSDLLRGAYSSVQNLEILELPQLIEKAQQKTRFSFPDESVEEPESPRSPVSPRSKGSRSERNSRKSEQKRPGSTAAESFKSAVKRSSTSSLLKVDAAQADEAAAEKQKQHENEIPLKARLHKSLTSAPFRRSSLPGVVRKLQDARMDRRRSSESETVDLVSDEHLGREPSTRVAVLFGVSAFVEVLCRVAFIRLGSYGNFVQQSSPAYARIVWLITYLRYMFCSLRAKNEQYTASKADCLGEEDGEDHARPVPRLLQKALQTLPADWGKPAARVSEDIPLGDAVVHPKPGIGCKKKKRKARQGIQANHPRLAPSLHTSPAIRLKMHNLAISAQKSLADRKSRLSGQKHVQPSPQAPLSRTAKRTSTILTTALFEKAKEVASSRSNSKEQIPAQVQNNSKESAADNKDVGPNGAPRTLTSKSSSDQSGSRPDSVGSSLGSSSSDESLQEETQQVMTRTKKEVETPVAKGRRISNGKITHADLQNQTRALLERSTGGKECWSLDELFEAEAGKSCVLDGYCSICERSVRARQWGNPRCRGCSIVDYLPFEHHLFKLVLTERSKWNVTYKALVTDLPPGVDKYQLTPPPVGDLDVILEKYFGHNKESIEAMK